MFLFIYQHSPEVIPSLLRLIMVEKSYLTRPTKWAMANMLGAIRDTRRPSAFLLILSEEKKVSLFISLSACIIATLICYFEHAKLRYDQNLCTVGINL